MEEKKYLVNDLPTSPYELIMLARELDRDYDVSHYYETSKAEEILNRWGYKVNLK